MEKCCINLICEEVNDRSLVLYDSKTGDDFPAGKEYNEGEYLVLIDKSGIYLDLSSNTLHTGDDPLSLTDCLCESIGIRLFFDG